MCFVPLLRRNSGSPVLTQPRLTSIGAHVYGGTFNSASVIGRYGNPFDDYIAAINITLDNEGLNLIPIKNGDAVTPAHQQKTFIARRPNSFQPAQAAWRIASESLGDIEAEEGFF